MKFTVLTIVLQTETHLFVRKRKSKVTIIKGYITKLQINLLCVLSLSVTFDFRLYGDMLNPHVFVIYIPSISIKFLRPIL